MRADRARQLRRPGRTTTSQGVSVQLVSRVARSTRHDIAVAGRLCRVTLGGLQCGHSAAQAVREAVGAIRGCSAAIVVDWRRAVLTVPLGEWTHLEDVHANIPIAVIGSEPQLAELVGASIAAAARGELLVAFPEQRPALAWAKRMAAMQPMQALARRPAGPGRG